jgi:vancomycin permeability regulator SanA
MIALGRIDARVPIPLSLIVCIGLLLVARSAWSEPKPDQRSRWWIIAVGGAGLVALFPLALMIFFGNTDYRRSADAVVVFGARVFPDGRMSSALSDRPRTACELYRAGLVKRLVLSGGPGEGSVTEADAMRTYALSHGVRAEDIFVDNQGLNTEATIRDTMPLFQKWHANRILVVSHFYHLPRIKLAYQRAGIDVYTVPAPQGRMLGKLPFYMAREAAAFWAYYLKDKPMPAAGV